MSCSWPWLANDSLLWKRSLHLLLAPNPTEITLIWSHMVTLAISGERNTVQPDNSRLHFGCIIHTLNFHSFLTHLSTKMQGILLPKGLKKSSLDRFYCFNSTVFHWKMFPWVSLKSLHFSAPSCRRGKFTYLGSLPQTSALFHLLWMSWYSGRTYCCSFLLTDSPRKAKDSFHLLPSVAMRRELNREVSV